MATRQTRPRAIDKDKQLPIVRDISELDSTDGLPNIDPKPPAADGAPAAPTAEPVLPAAPAVVPVSVPFDLAASMVACSSMLTSGDMRT